jgi:short-subunit dehydrogenase
MRERLCEDGKVHVVCPGFATTPMAHAYLGWKPLEISPEDAARRIIRGLEHNRAVIAFPWRLAFAARFQQALPDTLRRLESSAFRFRIVRQD